MQLKFKPNPSTCDSDSGKRGSPPPAPLQGQECIGMTRTGHSFPGSSRGGTLLHLSVWGPGETRESLGSEALPEWTFRGGLSLPTCLPGEAAGPRSDCKQLCSEVAAEPLVLCALTRQTPRRTRVPEVGSLFFPFSFEELSNCVPNTVAAFYVLTSRVLAF